MEEKRYQDIYIRPLTPKIVLEYLNFKKEYEGKDFLGLWEKIVPKYFTEESFCVYVDILRKKRIETASMENEANKKKGHIAFNMLLQERIGHTDIDLEGFKKLVGTLMSVYRSSKFKEFTQNYKQNIAYVLDQIHQEKSIEIKKRQEKLHIKNQKEADLKKQIEAKIEIETVVNKELFSKYSTAQQEFLNTKEVEYILTREDNDELFHSVWKSFVEENILPKKTLDKIYNEFYQKFIY